MWMTLNGQKHSVAEKVRLLEPTAQMWMKTDPYYQRQKCTPMTLVSGNIRCMRIFSGCLLAGRQMRVEVSTTAIFGDLSGYFFENFRDKASNIIWLGLGYRPIRRPLSAYDWFCKMNDLEWPWVAISCRNSFSTSKAVARLPLPLR